MKISMDKGEGKGTLKEIRAGDCFTSTSNYLVEGGIYFKAVFVERPPSWLGGSCLCIRLVTGAAFLVSETIPARPVKQYKEAGFRY